MDLEFNGILKVTTVKLQALDLWPPQMMPLLFPLTTGKSLMMTCHQMCFLTQVRVDFAIGFLTITLGSLKHKWQ